MQIATIILAAGPSSRMGKPKQLLKIRNKSLLHLTIDAALLANLGEVIVVVGSGENEIRNEIRSLPVTVVVNEAWKEGMGSSIRSGVQRAIRDHINLDAVIILVCDQPLISSHHLASLANAYAGPGKSCVASGYENTWGVPALFERSQFPHLLALRGNEGAKKLLDIVVTTVIPFPEGSVDIDTPDDYDKWKNAE